MKKRIRFICYLPLLIALLLFSGCASTMTTYRPDGSIESTQPGSIFGPSSYDIGYAGMYQSWRAGQTERATTIAKLPCPADPVAAAYCNNSKMMGMAMMSMESFTVKAPTTGFDVLYKGVDSIVPVAGFVSLYKLGLAGINKAGNVSFGDKATLNNSLNNSYQTNFGQGTIFGTQPMQDPLVVRPEIITPELLPPAP